MNIITTDMLSSFLQKDKRLFEEILPELIKRLIISESEPDTIRIPDHSDIWVPGFDGTVKLNKKSKHVAKGTSFWEFGTQKNYIGKINSDYEKRTSETNERTRNSTSLYLVTPRIWKRKESIIDWQSNHSGWKKVVVYDGISLTDWINSEPSVCTWLISQFNGVKMSFSTPVQAWDDFSNYTSPSFVASLFSVDRDKDITDLIYIIQQRSIIKVKSDFYLDALGFVLVSLLSDSYLREMAIVVNDYESYVSISSMVSNKILLLSFPCDKKLYNNNHTILCFGKTAYSIKADISLFARQRRHVEHALEEMGFSKGEASKMYRKTHGNLKALVRLIPGTANLTSPDWTKENDLHLLYPLLCLECINRSYDRDLVESLSGEKYEVIEKKYKEFSRMEDSPVKEIGGYFVIINFEEVWDYLCPSPEDVQFQKLTNTIISTIDHKTKYDNYHRRIPLEQQLLSILVWYSYEHSDSARFTEFITRLLNERSGNHKAIYDNLHIVAEALPETTLRVLEDDINNQKSYLYYAFENNSYSSILMALEELTMNEMTAYQSCILLHSLAVMDRKYFYSNNPYNSLASTLSFLNMYSAITIDEKIALLKLFVEQDGKWGTRFTSDVLVTDHFYWTERIGKKERNAFTTLTYGVYFDAVYELSNCIIFKCNESGYIDPIINLINHYWLFRPQDLSALANVFQASSFSQDDLVNINHLLRKKACYIESNETRQGYKDSLSKWIKCTTTNDHILKWAWAFHNYYDCPDMSLLNCYADLDNDQTYKFRKRILSSLNRKCTQSQISNLSCYMDNMYGWGRIINSLSDNKLVVEFCYKARELKKYSLLAGCLDCLDITTFKDYFETLDCNERKYVLPYVCRRDVLDISMTEDELIFYWSQKCMRQFSEDDYCNLLIYNPYGLLYYCKEALENGDNIVFNTINEVLCSIVDFENKWSLPNQWKDLVEEIIVRVDEVYYSQKWALMCLDLQKLNLVKNNTEGINRYLFDNPQILLEKYKESCGFYSGFVIPCAHVNLSSLKDFFDFLIDQDKVHFASQIISRTLIEDKEFPSVVMDYLEENSNPDFDKEIASCIATNHGFTWAADGTNQRRKADKYMKIANSIDASHNHTKLVFMTLSKIYAQESTKEDVEGELYF